MVVSSLPPEGRQIARRLMVRHHLIERMLHEQFGMEWYKTHDEAERLEHAVSADFEAKLVAKSGPGGVCPHGNPVMPETAATRRRRGMQLLSSAETGHSYRVRSTSEHDRKLLEYLDKRGIRPGAVLRILDRNVDEAIVLNTVRARCTSGKLPRSRCGWSRKRIEGGRAEECLNPPIRTLTIKRP